MAGGSLATHMVHFICHSCLLVDAGLVEVLTSFGGLHARVTRIVRGQRSLLVLVRA